MGRRRRDGNHSLQKNQKKFNTQFNRKWYLVPDPDKTMINITKEQ
jgi:hypothetical protein